jgi:hypothetical protein
MRIFATKEIECGGKKRLFKVNMYNTALFTDYRNIKLSGISDFFSDPGLLDLMLMAWFCLVKTDEHVTKEEFMTWYDTSDLFTEFPELLNNAFEFDEKPGKQRGKPKEIR